MPSRAEMRFLLSTSACRYSRCDSYESQETRRRSYHLGDVWRGEVVAACIDIEQLGHGGQHADVTDGVVGNVLATVYLIRKWGNDMSRRTM